MLKRLAVALVATTMLAAPVLAAGENGNPVPATAAPAGGGAAHATGRTASTSDQGAAGTHKRKPHRHVMHHHKRGKHYASHARSATLAKHTAKQAKTHKVRVSHRATPSSTSATRSGT